MRQPRRARRTRRRARSRRRSQPFARASASAPARSRAASSASARSRSRSVGASSSDQVSAESGRRRVQRRTSSGVEERLHLVPERARLARAAVVGRRLAHEVEPLERARARRVEEVAVAADRVRALQPRAALVERCAARRRRGTATTSRAAAGSPPRGRARRRRRSGACARAARSTTATRPGSSPRERPQRLPLERRRDVLARELAGERAPALELAEEPVERLVRAQVEPRRLADRRRLEPVGVAQHARREHAHGVDRVVGVAQLGERRERRGRAASRPPRRRARAPARRGRAAGPRRSRRRGARRRRTASAGS